MRSFDSLRTGCFGPLGIVTITLLVSTACTQPSRTDMNMSTPAAVTDSNGNPSNNPLFVESTLPYKLPPLDRIRPEHFRPALDAGMAEQRREIDAITNDGTAPTFANTIVPLEKSGQLLARATGVFSSVTASNTNPELEQIQTEMSPKLSAHSDWIFLNPELFARVNTLHERRASLGLDPESLRLIERYYILFVRSGAKLNDADKAKLKQMNEELSTRGHKVYAWPESTWLAGAVCTIVADHRNGVLNGGADTRRPAYVLGW